MFLAKERDAKRRRKKSGSERRKYMSAIETATLSQFIIESHKLTKHPLCIHQDDAMGCYDRIIKEHMQQYIAVNFLFQTTYASSI